MTATQPTDRANPWPDASRDAWRAAVDRDLKGVPFEKRLVSRTYEGLEIQPLYTRDDWDNSSNPTGAPGTHPRTRGATPLGCVTEGWSIREERAEADPAALNAAILDDLIHGADAINIRVSHEGMPNDAHTTASGSAAGAVVATVDDLERALKGVHLGMITLGFVPGDAFVEIAGLARSLLDRRGDDPKDARLAFNADPIAELARSGVLPASVGTMLDRLGTLAAWTDTNLPGSTAVRVSTAPYHDANATAAQDLACAMSTGIAYMRAMTRAGLTPDRAARQIAFQFSLSTNFFLAIAKLRAARRLWSEILKGCGVPEAGRVMRIETRTARRSLTHRDPWINMLRNTAACFAGAVGGADAVLSVPFDEPIGGPSVLSRRIARNTQTILSRESNLHRVIDPTGGSYYLEHLTDDLAKTAWRTMQDIERAGGMPAALEEGPLRGWIAEAYSARLRNIAKRKDAVTGVSEFPQLHEEQPPREPDDHRQVLKESARRLESRQHSETRTRLLEEITRDSGSSQEAPSPFSMDRMNQILRAAEAGACILEMSKALNQGEAPERTEPLAPHPYAEPFEAMRDASDAFYDERGHRPSVVLVAVGPPAEYTARANFMSGFFEAGGFEVHTSATASGVDAAAESFRQVHTQHGADIAAICAADHRYPELVPALAPALHAAGARTVLLAGRPGDAESEFRDAGVDRFVFMGCDVLATLTELLHEEGAIS